MSKHAVTRAEQGVAALASIADGRSSISVAGAVLISAHSPLAAVGQVCRRVRGVFTVYPGGWAPPPLPFETAIAHRPGDLADRCR